MEQIKNIISLVLESAAPDVLRGHGDGVLQSQQSSALPEVRPQQGTRGADVSLGLSLGSQWLPSLPSLPATFPYPLAMMDAYHHLGIQLAPLNPQRRPRTAVKYAKRSH